jgi:hypothetical protein
VLAELVDARRDREQIEYQLLEGAVAAQPQ